MIYLRRMFMVSAALVAIHMQGCGCNDHDKKYNPPAESKVQVGGTASKGLLRGFTVSAYSVANGVMGTNPVATGTTGTDGSYTLGIPSEHSGHPLLLRVSPAASGSTMLCDLEQGCGTTGFGEAMPVAADSGLQMSAIVPSVTEGETANITAFTDIAAALAMAGFNSSSTEAAIRAAIASASSRVANRFGIAGDLTRIPVIDLTNPTAVAAAINGGNALLVRYAAINSAIISAVQSDNPTVSVAQALRMFVDAYVENGLAGNVSDEEDTGWGEILQFAQAVLVRVQTNLGPSSTVNLDGLIQALIADAQLANSETPDSYDQGTPSQTAGAAPIDKAKAMVQDLRDLAFSIGHTSVAGGTIESISDDFAMQVEAAQMAGSDDAAHLLEAMAMAASAIDDASRAHDANPDRTSYTGDNGVMVTIAMIENKAQFTVDQTIEVMGDTAAVPVEVVLTAINDVAMAETEQQNGSGMTANGTYEVMGSAQTSALVMMVKDGSSVSVTDMATVEVVSEQSPQLSETQTLEAFDLNLMVSVAQRNPNDPVTLTGNLTASLTDVMIKDTSSVNDISASEISEIRVGLASLKLFGEISNTTGESANFSLSVSGDATGVSFVDSWINGTETSSGETANNFADLYGSLAFTAKLTGIPSVVVMNYTLARTGLESGDNGLVVKYPGKMFRFTMAVEDGEPTGDLIITNQDGVTLTAHEVMVNGESRVEGMITYGGVQYATITEGDLVMVNFTDGNSVSLM